MPEPTARSDVWLVLMLLGLFALAVVLGITGVASDRAIGALLVLSGLGAVVFRRRLAAAQHLLAEKPYLPSHWREGTPRMFLLWGVGVTLIGGLMLAGM